MPYMGDIHSGIPGGSAGASGIKAVETIPDRDALKPALADREMVLVRDASADPLVDSGAAIYIYNAATDDFTKVSETESTDIVHAWNLILGKPTSTPAQIDAAVAASHSHPNKPVLDKFAESGQYVPKYNGLEIIRSTADSMVIYVAPDAGSAHPGDWGEHGSEGILSAYYETTKYLAQAGKILEIVARDGTFSFKDPMIFNHPQNVSVRLRAEHGAALPKIDDYSTHDIAHDQDLLRGAYPTRFTFEGWTAIDVSYGASAWIENILYESIAGKKTAIRARYGGQVRAGRISTINAYSGYYANDAAQIYGYWGGHHIADHGYLSTAIDGASIAVSGYKDDTVAGLYLNHGIYAVRGGNLTVKNSSSDAVYFRHIFGDVVNCQNESQVYALGVDVAGCRYAAYSTMNSEVYASDFKVRENSSLAYTYNNSCLYARGWDIPPDTEPDLKRRFYAHGNSWNVVDKNSFTGGSIVLSPVADTEGNMGAWNRLL